MSLMKPRSPSTTNSHCQVVLDLPDLLEHPDYDGRNTDDLKRPPLLRRKGHMQVSRLSTVTVGNDCSHPSVHTGMSHRPPLLRRKGHMQVCRLSECSSDSGAAIAGQSSKYIPITQLQSQRPNLTGLKIGHPSRPYYSALRRIASFSSSSLSESDLESDSDSDSDLVLTPTPLPTSATLFDPEQPALSFLKSPQHPSSPAPTFIITGATTSPRSKMFGPLPYPSAKSEGKGFSLSGEVELKILLSESKAVKKGSRRRGMSLGRNFGSLLSIRRR